MPTYVLGDVQGCFLSLQKLLRKIHFTPGSDHLIFCGDTINRGTGSLEVLQFMKKHDDSVSSVLGNHELHLLATNNGERQLKPLDTIETILNHPKSKKWLGYIKTWPFAIELKKHLVVHASIAPHWDIAEAMDLSQRLSKKINKGKNVLATSKAAQWFTLARYVEEDGSMNFQTKSAPEDAPSHLLPWYKVKRQKELQRQILFGHWASLGHREKKRWISLDSGCVWGGRLTAWCIEEQQSYSVAAVKEDLR